MATKREYLVSLGLAKPGRGKFSREAHAALAKAEADGMVFDEAVPSKPAPKATKTVDVAPEKAPPRPTPKAMPQKRKPVVQKEPVREQNHGYLVRTTTQGHDYIVQFDNCGVCNAGVAYCECADGPHIPKWFGEGLATLVRPEV